MEAKDVQDKLDRLDEMLAKLSKAVEEGNPVLEMPPAAGMIAECQTDGIALASVLADECQMLGIPVWIDGRSLLAACRTQNLLPWETVLEIGLFESDWSRVRIDILPKISAVLEDGKVRPAEKPKFGRICAEIAPRIWTMDKAVCHSVKDGQTAWTTEECIVPLGNASLNGMQLPSPAKPWSILEAEFGSGWQKIV